MQETKTKKPLRTNVIVKAGFLATVSVVLTRFFSLMLLLGGLPALRVGFGSIPLIMAGMMFGPVVGGITGVVSDIVGYMINPMGGAFFPGFTLSAALYGIISGLLFKKIKIQNFKVNFNIINALVMIVFGIGLFLLVMNTGLPTDSNTVLIIILMILVTALFIVIPFVISLKFKGDDRLVSFDKIAFVVSVTYVINALFLNTLWLSIMFDQGFIAFLPGRVIAAVVTIPIYTIVIYTLGRLVNLLDQ